MDQQPDIPQISPKINREEQEDEKKRGAFAGLFSRLGLGSSATGGWGGASGAGGLGNALGRAGLFGGMLATKAGLIGLILVGTTVAGSLGVVGYKLFGPTAADRTDADFSSLFAPKPKNAASAADQGRAASAGGASQSLDYLAKANAGNEEPQPNAADAAGPAEAANPTPNAPSVLPNINAGAAVAKPKLTRKTNDMAAKAAAAGGASSAASGSAASGSALPATAKTGTLSGASASSVRPASGLTRALTGAKRAGSAMRQAGMVLHDQHSAQSSAGAGKTYDGNAQAASQIAPEAGVPGAGAEQGGVGANPTVNPQGAGQSTKSTAPPAAPGVNVTPWQGAINTSMLLVMLSAGLLLAANMITKIQGISFGLAKFAVIALASLAIAAAMAVIAFGAMIAGGQYGQILQGRLLMVAGACLAATGAILIASVANVEGPTEVKPGAALPAEQGGGPMSPEQVTAANQKANTASMEALATAMGGNTQMLMLCCGGMGLAATAWAYLAKPQQYPSSEFNNGNPPDWNHRTAQAPSANVLDRYLA